MRKDHETLYHANAVNSEMNYIFTRDIYPPFFNKWILPCSVSN